MDTYAYLLLGLALLAPLVGILVARKDLVRTAVKLGIIGGVAGLVSELFYFRDYWRPPSLLGMATISVEDFIFGFAITALSFAAYPWISRSGFKSAYPKRVKLYGSFFIAGLLSMLVFNLYVGVNSIFVSSAVFVCLTGVMLMMRPDLIRPGIYSAAGVTVFIAAIYVIIFGILAPDFWERYWLLAGTRWGVTLPGSIPLTELLWYATWILFASVSYPFVSGKHVRPV